jgi:hypothetical protein
MFYTKTSHTAEQWVSNAWAGNMTKYYYKQIIVIASRDARLLWLLHSKVTLVVNRWTINLHKFFYRNKDWFDVAVVFSWFRISHRIFLHYAQHNIMSWNISYNYRTRRESRTRSSLVPQCICTLRIFFACASFNGCMSMLGVHANINWKPSIT